MTRLAGTASAAALMFLCATPAAADIPACLAPAGEIPQIDGVEVRDLPEGEGKYAILRVEAARGAHMLIYYDAASQSAARERAACLGAQLNLLQDELGDTREGAEWASAVFTSDPNYTPPRQPGAKPRWKVQTGSSQEIPINAERMILGVIPHEQVHDFQAFAGRRLPRWFAEGHATWVGTRISSILRSGEGEADRAETKGRLSTATGPLDLAEWGSVRPKREAIMRQVSAEDRARMEADPDYHPSGSFRFTTDDLEGDESNMLARYAGALLVFEGLEERHGVAKVSAWAIEIASGSGYITPEEMAESIRRHFGEDLDTLLGEPVPPPRIG